MNEAQRGSRGAEFFARETHPSCQRSPQLVKHLTPGQLLHKEGVQPTAIFHVGQPSQAGAAFAQIARDAKGLSPLKAEPLLEGAIPHKKPVELQTLSSNDASESSLLHK